MMGKRKQAEASTQYCRDVRPTNQVEIDDLSEFLKSVIEKLPAAQKEAIDLAFFKGMSQRAIASEKRIALGTIKTQLHLALRKLHS